MHLAQIKDLYQPSMFTDFSTLPADILSRVLSFAIGGAGLYFLYILITAGYTFISSMGDEAKVRGVHKQVSNALLGLLVVVCSYFILQIVQKILGLNIL